MVAAWDRVDDRESDTDREDGTGNALRADKEEGWDWADLGAVLLKELLFKDELD